MMQTLKPAGDTRTMDYTSRLDMDVDGLPIGPYQDPDDENIWHGSRQPNSAGMKNGPRYRYDLRFFGDQVKFWRIEEKHLSLPAVGAIVEKRLGHSSGDTYWRRLYEGMGHREALSTLNPDGERHTRKGIITPEKCRDIARVLDMPEEQILTTGAAYAGYVPFHNVPKLELDSLYLRFDEEQREKLIQYARRLKQGKIELPPSQ